MNLNKWAKKTKSRVQSFPVIRRYCILRQKQPMISYSYLIADLDSRLAYPRPRPRPRLAYPRPRPRPRLSSFKTKTKTKTLMSKTKT